MNNILQIVTILLQYRTSNVFNYTQSYVPYTPLRNNMKQKIEKFKNNSDENILLFSSNPTGMYNYYLVKFDSIIYEILVSGMILNEEKVEYIKEYAD